MTWHAPITVDWSLQDGAATAPADYPQNQSGTVTFGAGETSKTFTVQTTEDTLPEGDETLKAVIAAPQGGFPPSVKLGDSEGLGTIRDDDTATLSVADAAPVNEGSPAEFTVSLDKAAAVDLTVKWETETGTAGSGDYEEESDGRVTIPAGQTSAKITVTTKKDSVSDGGEKFTVRASAPPGGLPTWARMGETVGEGTITEAPVVTFTPADGAVVSDPSINVLVAFGEAVRKANGDVLDAAAAALAVTLKKVGEATDLAGTGQVTVNAGKTVITLDPANALESGQRYTVTLLLDTVEDLQGNEIGSDQSATFTVDADAPVVTFTPADGAVVSDPSINVLVAFGEAVRKANGDVLDAAAAALAVTLKKVGEATDLAGTGQVTVNAGKTVITLDPANALESGQRYTVTLLLDTVEDLQGNEIGSDQSATFTVDADAPVVTFTPADGAVVSDPSINVLVAFGEAVRKANGDVLDAAAAALAVTLKKVGEATDLAGTGQVTVNAGKTVITLDPANALESGQRYTVTLLLDTVEDLQGNEIGSDQSATFTVDADAPVVTFTPADGAVVSDPSINVLVAFGEAVRKANGDVLDAAAAALAVTLKKVGEATDLAGTGQVTVNAGKTVITLDPANALESGQRYTVTLLLDTVEDLQGNEIGSDQSATFTVDADAPVVTFTPADGAVVSDPSINVLVAFGEAVRKANGDVLDAAAAALAVTLKKVGEATDLAGTGQVTVNAGKTVITLDPANALESGQRYTVTLLLDTVEDLQGNEIGSDQSATFTVDADAPVVTFTPADGAVVSDPSINVLVAFGEAVRKANGDVLDAAAAALAVTLKKVGEATDLAGTGQVTVNAGKTVITLDPANALESGQRYTVTLLLDTVEDLQGNEIGSDQSATFTVDADAPVVTISVADAAAREGETVTFEVTLSSEAGADVILNWTTADGTAKVSGDPTIPDDYTAGAGSLTIVAGATSGTIAVRTVEDRMAEDDETFTVALSAPAAGLPEGVALTDAEAVGTIEDDDGAPTKIVLIATDAKGDVMTEIPEDGGETAVTVTAKVEGGSSFPEKRVVRTRVESSGAGGVVGFMASPNAFDIEIPADHVSASRIFVLTPEDDGEDEDDETVVISGEMVPEAGGRTRRAAAPSAIPVIPAELTLLDDDEIGLNGDTEVTVPEGETHVGRYAVNGMTAATKITWSLTGEDARSFEIDGDGTLAFRTAPDFEAPSDENGDNLYRVAVAAAVDGAQTLTVVVTVRVVNVNEPLAFEQAGYAFELEENRPGPVALGAVVATDPDAGDTVAYAIAAGDTDLFSVGAASGILSYIGPGEDYETEPNVYELTVSATDRGGLSAAAAVTVEILNVNEAPVFEQDSYAFELAENWIGPVELGTLTATDPDAGDTVSYAIAGGDESLFAIDAASGVLTYIGPGEDYETEPNSYDLTVTATDRKGLSGEAGVTVTVTDEDDAIARARLLRVNEAILPELARTIVSGVLGSVTARIEEARTGASGEARVAIAGHPVGAPAADGEDPEEDRPWDGRDPWQETPEAGTMDWKEALRGTSFALPLGGGDDDGTRGGPGAVTVWGGGDWRSLSGGDGESPVEWDGDVVAARLGVDARLRENLLAGLAVDWSRGSFDWIDRGEAGYREMEGTHGSGMTSVHPYAAWWPDGRTGLWASLGYGRGEVEIEDEEAGRQRSDAALGTAAAGGRVRLFSGEDVIPGGTTSLALEGEAWAARFEVADNGDRMAGLTVDTNRLRLGLEGAHERRLAGGGSLTPSLEVGLRHDGGDGETGLGVELGGGLAWRDPALGLTVEGWGRALLMHEGDVGDWGAGGSVRLDPGAGGLGLSFALRPSWGAAAEGGVDRLWQDGQDSPFALAAANDNEPSPAAGLDAEIGYGLPAFGGHGVLTPHGGLSLSEGSRTWRAGGRLAVGPSITLGLEGERRESANDPPDHGLMLRATARW